MMLILSVIPIFMSMKKEKALDKTAWFFLILFATIPILIAMAFLGVIDTLIIVDHILQAIAGICTVPITIVVYKTYKQTKDKDDA